MKALYDQLDQNGVKVAVGIQLLPGMALPEGHFWVPHQPSLAELKYAKKQYIEQNRNRECFEPVFVLEHWWQCDSRSQELLNSTILMASSGVVETPLVWRSLNNEDVLVSLQDLRSIAGAIAAKTKQSYQHSWDLKASLEEANTPEQVESITW